MTKSLEIPLENLPKIFNDLFHNVTQRGGYLLNRVSIFGGDFSEQAKKIGFITLKFGRGGFKP